MNDISLDSDKVLTIKDILDFLQEESAKNPVGFTGFTFGCKRISIYDLPVEEDMDGVDSTLTTKKILTID